MKYTKTSTCFHIYPLSQSHSAKKPQAKKMAAEVLSAAFAAAHRALSSSDEPHPPPPPGPEGDPSSAAWPTAGADESSFEYWMDGLLGLAFLITTLISAKR